MEGGDAGDARGHIRDWTVCQRGCEEGDNKDKKKGSKRTRNGTQLDLADAADGKDADEVDGVL